MKTKTFDLGTVLSVTTGRLLTDIGNLYGILGWMTDDEPFTHQLPRFNDECRPWLLRWFPELDRATAYLADLDILIARDAAEPAVKKWLADLNDVWRLGVSSTYEVPRIPHDGHQRKNALTELVEMVGPDKVIPVVVPPKAEGRD